MSRPPSPSNLPVFPAEWPDTDVQSAPSLLTALSIMFVVALLAFRFAKLGSEVLEGETRSFDMHALQAAVMLRSSNGWLAG